MRSVFLIIVVSLLAQYVVSEHPQHILSNEDLDTTPIPVRRGQTRPRITHPFHFQKVENPRPSRGHHTRNLNMDQGLRMGASNHDPRQPIYL